MSRPTKQALELWYKEFSKILMEQAEIDVNSPGDLGRVKNFQIVRWDATNHDSPDVRITYAYAPQEDGESVVPYSETATKNQHDKWMVTNLKPATTEDQVLQLYNMSRAGTLMITAPQKGLKDIQMVRTDSNGKIIVSQPISAYRNGGNENLPVQDRIPDMPAKPAASLNPEDYGIRPRPAAPQQPANMHPGFFSWLGYILGFNTDYTKLRRYERDMSAYNEAAQQWDNDQDNLQSYTERDEESGAERYVGYNEFREARMEHQEFEVQLETYQSNHLGKFGAIANSAAKLADTNFWKNEQALLETAYKSTPLGKAKTELAKAVESLGYEKRTDLLVHHWMGHNANPQKATELYGFRVDNFSPKQLELPKSPDFDNMSEDQKREHMEEMSTLFDFAGLGAISHPDILGEKPRHGCTAEETARIIFGALFNDMFTHGRSNPTEYFVYVDPAREKALAAMEAYSKGQKEQLGQLLGCGMRQMLREAASLGMFTEHTLNTPYLIGKLYNTMQKDPDLLAASGLNEEEVQEIQANMELYKILHQGVQAKKDLLDHALGNRTLDEKQLQQAAQDVLICHSAVLGLTESHNASQDAIYEGEEYKALHGEYYSREANMMKKAGQTKNEARGEDRKEFVKNRMNYLTSIFPPNKFTMQLSDKDWLQQYKQAILDKANISRIGNMDRQALRDLFSKTNEEIFASLMPSSNIQAEDQKHNEKQLENAASALANNEPNVHKDDQQLGIN